MAKKPTRPPKPPGPRKTRRSAFFNGPPNTTPPDAPDYVKIEFAKRLQSYMLDFGWNQSELARQAAKHMPDGKFGRDNVSGYMRAKFLPTPTHLTALCKALSTPKQPVDPRDLVPSRGMPTVDEKLPPRMRIEGLEPGRVMVRINMVLDELVALQIQEIIAKSETVRGGPTQH